MNRKLRSALGWSLAGCGANLFPSPSAGIGAEPGCCRKLTSKRFSYSQIITAVILEVEKNFAKNAAKICAAVDGIQFALGVVLRGQGSETAGFDAGGFLLWSIETLRDREPGVCIPQERSDRAQSDHNSSYCERSRARKQIHHLGAAILP